MVGAVCMHLHNICTYNTIIHEDSLIAYTESKHLHIAVHAKVLTSVCNVVLAFSSPLRDSDTKWHAALTNIYTVSYTVECIVSPFINRCQ